MTRIASHLSQPPPPFQADAHMVVQMVRSVFSEALTSIGIDPGEPQAIARTLGLNKNLAWKISKIVQADDPAIVLQQMPGTGGVKIFLQALQRAGVAEEMLRAARAASDEYDRLIEVHSGDRATLEMMGGALSRAADPQRDEYHRKLLFQGASYVWGVQSRVLLKIGIVGPSSRPHMLDFVSLNAHIDFRRIRPDVTWIMASRHANFDDGGEMTASPSEPIDPAFAAPDQAPLVGEFCSQPLPELRRLPNRYGARYELVEGRVGNTGASTCVVGMIQRNIPAFGDSEADWGRHLASCDTPAELLVLDLLIHESFTFAIPPEPALCSLAAVPNPPPLNDRKYLPLHEPLQDLGKPRVPPATPEVPRYRQMLQRMYDRVGWMPNEFHHFRVRIAYPAFPTAVELRYPLPPRPPDTA